MMFPFLLIIAISFGLTSGTDNIYKFHSESVCSNKLKCNLNNKTEIKVKDDPESAKIWDEFLEGTSIIFALSKIANEEILNQQCFKHFKTIERGILRKDPWAMKVRDCSGQKESGFIWGHNYWLGNKEGCAAVHEPIQITLSNRFERNMKEELINQMAPFEMDYKIVYMKHNSPWQIELKILVERVIHVGLCVPSACSLIEIKNLTQSLMDNNRFMENQILELDSEVIYVKDLKLKDSFFEQKSLKIVIGCFILTLIMITMAWLLSEMETNSSKLFALIKCFDIRRNARQLFSLAESGPNCIAIINGLRSVSCLWVLMCHVLLYKYFTLNNKAIYVSYAEKPILQHISTAPLIVDLLFAASGFLQTYLFIKDEKQVESIRGNSFRDNAKAFGKMAVYRYFRHPKVAKKLLQTGIVASIVWSYILAIKHQYSFSFDVIASTFSELYINPFVRIMPYLVGSIGGCWLAENKGELKISSTTEKYLWNLGGLLLIACVFSNLKRDLSPFYSITLLISTRLFIALMICWIIIASAKGHSTWWSKILEWPIFQHTNRLSYAIYILNPFIIDIFYSLSNSSSNSDFFQLFVVECGFAVITYFTSIVFSLAFEVPYYNLIRILLHKKTKSA